jgi:hypothetical protein
MYSTKKPPEHPGSANTLPNPEGAGAAAETAAGAAMGANHSGAPRGRTKFLPSAIMRNRTNRFAARADEVIE